MRLTQRDQYPREYWRRFATEKRTLSEILFEIDAPDCEGIVVRPFDSRQIDFAKLVNGHENWLTAKRGSVVSFWAGGDWRMERVQEVRIIEAAPERYRGLVVPSAMDWLEGVPALHRSQLQSPPSGIPCDLRGFIPTEETQAFDLDWGYSRPTHRYNGVKTPYGEQWEEAWPALKAEAIRKTLNAQTHFAADVSRS